MLQRCVRCLYDASTPSINFDVNGVCSYCQLHDQLNVEYPTGVAGEKRLQEMARDIRDGGRGKKYDCAVGVSGGCDSSYMLYIAKKELGLRPLAVHFDNTWDSTIAVENIHNVLRALGVDLYTHVVDNEEYDDIYRSFLKAGVADIEAATDIGLAATLYRAAAKFGVKYILEGHSFRTEGISPLGWLYMDGKYIQSIHNEFGTGKAPTFPNLWLSSFLYWAGVKRIKKLRPLYYKEYRKEDVKAFLARELGWKWYGGHHLENRFTAFYHSYFIPRRLKKDFRVLGFSALIRSGQLTREEGLRQLAEPPYLEPEMVALVKKRLGFDEPEFERLMTLPLRTYREFRTYKQTFERMKWLFWVMCQMDLVPKSFYLKFTAPDPAPTLVSNDALDQAHPVAERSI